MILVTQVAGVTTMVDTVTKTPNYTEEMTAEILEQYSSGVDLDAIA